MSEKTKGMKTIWYFVGLLMITVGGIIFATGMYYVVYPPEDPVVLHELHPDVWWGGIMVLFGIIMLWINKGATVE